MCNGRKLHLYLPRCICGVSHDVCHRALLQSADSGRQAFGKCGVANASLTSRTVEGIKGPLHKCIRDMHQAGEHANHMICKKRISPGHAAVTYIDRANCSSATQMCSCSLPRSYNAHRPTRCQSSLQYCHFLKADFWVLGPQLGHGVSSRVLPCWKDRRRALFSCLVYLLLPSCAIPPVHGQILLSL